MAARRSLRAVCTRLTQSKNSNSDEPRISFTSHIPRGRNRSKSPRRNRSKSPLRNRSKSPRRRYSNIVKKLEAAENFQNFEFMNFAFDDEDDWMDYSSDEKDRDSTSGQVPGVPPTIPGKFQNMFPFGTSQFGALPLKPAQAMAQQATRHALQVYVGGLPPLANEQKMVQMVLQASGSLPGGVGMPTGMAAEVPTKVVCLTEVVTVDELRDDVEYNDILEDMREEACKFGSLVNVVIPRPDANGEWAPGVGKVFLEYADDVGSARAKTALHGRKFWGNDVVALYYPEEKYSNRDYGA